MGKIMKDFCFNKRKRKKMDKKKKKFYLTEGKK